MCYGEILSAAIVKARKAHRCDGCGRPIRAGKSYYRQTWAQDGRLDTWKAHARCRALNHAADVWDSDGCQLDQQEVHHQAAKDQGWRELLAGARVHLKRLLAGER